MPFWVNTMNNKEQNEKQAYEERLQRRLIILKEELEKGKVHFAEGMKVIESLKAVRYAPDGSVDLSTVDAFVRSLALGIESMHDREELKKSISLFDIQNTYYSFIENNFKDFYQTMKKHNLSPHQVASRLSKSDEGVKELSKPLPEFIETIIDFWKGANEAASIHIEDMHDSLKGIFGGDLFPSNNESIASKCSLYIDTLVLPDPFIRSKDLFPRWSKSEQVYYLIKHALNLLQYKDLACLEGDKPLITILADKFLVDDYEIKYITKMGEEDALYHANKMFGKKFDTYQEFMKFAEGLNSIEKLVKEIKIKDRVLFDTDWGNSVEEQFAQVIQASHTKLLGTQNPGIILSTSALGRMSVSNEILFKSSRLRGTPIIDAPTSWQYFNWKLEYDADRYKEMHDITNKHLHILKGLQSLADGEMEWLGKIPHEALIEIRKEGALGEIRAILSNGIEEMISTNPSDFQSTSEKVMKNIYESFRKHKENITELKKKKWKFAGKDIGSWLVVGTLSVAAAATGTPLWGLGALAADQIMDAPKLKDIPSSMKKLAEESKKINRSPIGLLFKYKNKA
jgi:hypothetical protein